MMKPQERAILEKLSTTADLGIWIHCARAELASDPSNAALYGFIRLAERLHWERQAVGIANLNEGVA